MIKAIFKPLPQKNLLVEANQENEIKFAYSNENYEAQHLFVKCRDYLGDVVWSESWKQPITKWGFSWAPIGLNFDKTRFFLKIKQENASFFTNLVNNLDYLQTTLKTTIQIYHIDTEKSENVEQNHLYLYLESDKIWVSSILHVSFFTYIIKCACCYPDMTVMFTPEFLDLQNKAYSLNTERHYAARYGKDYFRSLLENSLDILSQITNPCATDTASPSAVHGSSGFVSRYMEIKEIINNKKYNNEMSFV